MTTASAATSTLPPPTTTPPSQRRQQYLDEIQAQKDRIEALESTLRAKESLMDSHIELVEDYRAEVEAEKKKAENFESDLLAIDLERNRLKVENDKLKQSATTPRPPPPVPGSVQAIIDANHDDVNKLCATIIANQRPASAADPGTSRVNPAARYIECNNLEDPAHVTLHDYMSWRHSFELYSIANNIDKEPYSSRKAFVTQKLHIHWRPLIQMEISRGTILSLWRTC